VSTICLVLHLPKTHPDQSNLEYAYALAGKVRQVSDPNQGVRDSGTKIVGPYLGRKLSISADNLIFGRGNEGAIAIPISSQLGRYATLCAAS
jgi:hypothetical protein